MENEVLGPMVREKLERGREEGRQQGIREVRQEAMQEMLRETLTEKFGELPSWAVARLSEARAADLEIWAKRLLKDMRLEELLG